MTESRKPEMTWKLLGGMLALISAVFTSFLFLDGRYAHADDMGRSLNDLTLDIQQSSVGFKLEVIDDKLKDLYNKEDTGKQLNDYEVRTKTDLIKQRSRYVDRMDSIEHLRKENRLYYK